MLLDGRIRGLELGFSYWMDTVLDHNGNDHLIEYIAHQVPLKWPTLVKLKDIKKTVNF